MNYNNNTKKNTKKYINKILKDVDIHSWLPAAKKDNGIDGPPQHSKEDNASQAHEQQQTHHEKETLEQRRQR